MYKKKQREKKRGFSESNLLVKGGLGLNEGGARINLSSPNVPKPSQILLTHSGPQD